MHIRGREFVPSVSTCLILSINSDLRQTSVNILGKAMSAWDDLEQRIRDRGVRVEERIELLRLLRSNSAEERAVTERRAELLEEIRRAAGKVREELG